MGCLLERNSKIVFVSSSSVNDNGKKRRVVVESRPEYAIIRLNGSRKRFPIAWEAIYEIAKRHHEKNLRLEASAKQPGKSARTTTLAAERCKFLAE